MILHTGGYLAFFMPDRKTMLEIHLDKATSLLEIVNRLEIPPAEIFLTAVNGTMVDLEEAIVEDGDKVRIISAVDGG